MIKLRRGFTLIELLVVIAIIALLIGILLPALGKARQGARDAASMSNLRQLAVARENYGSTYRDAIYNYTWTVANFTERRNAEMQDPTFGPPFVNDETLAAQYQMAVIIRNKTGRVSGEYEIKQDKARMPHRRWHMLPLLDFMSDTLPNPIAASPNDRNLVRWQQDWKTYPNGQIPVGDSSASDGDGTFPWSNPQTQKRWPYASSYQSTVYAFSTDNVNEPMLYPGGASNVMYVPNSPLTFKQRRITQVGFPSSKVHLFEEFDWASSNHYFYAYPQAKINMMFFDASVRSEATADANEGWNPENPSSPVPSEFQYDPIDPDYFPDTVGDPTMGLKGYYRWTRGGLRGIDFGGKEIDTGQLP